MDRTKAPEFKKIESVSFIQPTHLQLKNGLKIHVISGGSQDIVKIDFIFKAGTYFQPKLLVAGATNHLLKEGTKNYNSFEIAEGIDQYGAYLQNSYDMDRASVTLFTRNQFLKEVLVYIQEVILYPKFDENEFNLYINNAKEKYKISIEKVAYVAKKESMSQIFGSSNPYGANATAEDFDKISILDVIDFHKKYYQLGNCELILSGKVTEECISLLEKYFGKIPLADTKIDNAIESTQTNTPNKIFINKPNSLQSAIRIGKKIPNKLHKDYMGLAILNTILGGYFGSRLMKNIREDKGYTYGINSGMVSLRNDGFFYISTEVGSDVTKEALHEIYKEIELLKTEKICKEELTLVKNYIMGKILKSCDGPFNMAELFEEVYFYELDYGFYNQYIHKINTITPEELMKLAQKYFVDFKEIVVGVLKN